MNIAALFRPQGAGLVKSWVKGSVAAIALSGLVLSPAWGGSSSPSRFGGGDRNDSYLSFNNGLYNAGYRGKSHKGGKHRSGHNRHQPKTYAKVMRAEPILQPVAYRLPQQQCWTEQVRYSGRADSYRSPAPALIGGIIGAAIGSNLGRKHHQDHQNIQTVAGGLLGAVIGRDIGARHQPHSSKPYYREEQRCSTEYQTHWEQKVVGYDVTYRFRGETYHTRMDYDPGDKILVNVQVRPVI